MNRLTVLALFALACDDVAYVEGDGEVGILDEGVATTPEPQAEELAHIPRADGGALSIYLTPDGGILYTEDLPVGGVPSEVDGLRPLEVWEAYGEGPAPARLRLIDAMYVESGDEDLAEDGPPAPPSSTATDFYYNDLYYCSGFHGGSFEFYYPNWGGGFYASATNVWNHCTVVQPYSGNVVMNLSGQGSWNVLQDTLRWAKRPAATTWYGSWIPYTYYLTITNASSSGFHVAGHVWRL